MEIFVYKGLYNLPSIDFECLRTIVSIKINSNKFELKIFSLKKKLICFLNIEFHTFDQCSSYNSNQWKSIQVTERFITLFAVQ